MVMKSKLLETQTKNIGFQRQTKSTLEDRQNSQNHGRSEGAQNKKRQIEMNKIIGRNSREAK